MPAPELQLSKSDFLRYQTCPEYLWLFKNNPGVVPEDSEDTRLRLEQGNEVELYARELFPDGVLVESLGDKAVEDTERLVRLGATTIFQATVHTQSGLYAMADVLQQNPITGTWDIYEVKSTGSIKPNYYLDTAFQCTAFEEADYEIGRAHIVHINKEYVRRGAIDPAQLLVTDDITSEVRDMLPGVHEQAYGALDYLRSTEQEPAGCSCRMKTRSNHCPTFGYLNPDIPEYSVYDLVRIPQKTLIPPIEAGTYRIQDIPESVSLTAPQRNQVEAARKGWTDYDRIAIAERLGELAFPLHFLDYETASSALPVFEGTSPLQQVPFQFSLHVQHEPDGDLEHIEFLHEDGEIAPVPELLKSLRRGISGAGSVVVWNKSFEAARNREMAAQLPEYEGFMRSVNSRMFDLMEIFSKQLYVHPRFRGSTSIKAVLPVLVPELNHKELDISDGSSAQVKWLQAIKGGMAASERAETFASLRTYCGLDTLAMARIYGYLVELVATE